MDVTTHTLAVPGATLYYEVRGSGPVLLMICGGVYDAAGFAALAGELAGRYTVVTYDRRGNSRSPFTGPPQVQRVETHADDAAALLAAVGVTAAEPAAVFGNSSGATIGLSLVERHPGLVRSLVAHEPPVFGVLPDADRFREVVRATGEAFASGGPFAAIGVFGAGMGVGPETAGAGDGGGDGGAAGAGDGADDGAAAAAEAPVDPEVAARQGANLTTFTGYEIPGFATWLPDTEALVASATTITLGAGEASVGEPPHRAAITIAERLGSAPLTFPGGHGGFGSAPEAFALVLETALTRDH
jgi:pimeloyl-ACP methyl ester carboxylesterase